MTHIEQRVDKAAVWTQENPILHKGEVGWEEDTLKGKLGDGFSRWNALAYVKTTLAVTKSDVGLTRVDNTNDEEKPLSSAAREALDLKVSDSELTPILNALMLTMNPVGTIKMTDNNVNPGSYIGGTWSAYGAGRVPVGVDASQTEFDTVGKTGGEKAHALTADEGAQHSHTASSGSAGAHVHPTDSTPNPDPATAGTTTKFKRGDPSGATTTNSLLTQSAGAHTHTVTVNNAGLGTPHNNLQPYVTVYMWRRTA